MSVIQMTADERNKIRLGPKTIASNPSCHLQGSASLVFMYFGSQCIKNRCKLLAGISYQTELPRFHSKGWVAAIVQGSC